MFGPTLCSQTNMISGKPGSTEKYKQTHAVAVVQPDFPWPGPTYSNGLSWSRQTNTSEIRIIYYTGSSLMVEKENGCMYVWHHSTINCWLALGRPSREENDRVTEAQTKVGWWDFNICFSTAMAERLLQALCTRG